MKINDQHSKVSSMYMRDGRNENCKKIKKIVDEGIAEKVLIGGEFNARTGNKGGWM